MYIDLHKHLFVVELKMSSWSKEGCGYGCPDVCDGHRKLQEGKGIQRKKFTPSSIKQAHIIQDLPPRDCPWITEQAGPFATTLALLHSLGD